MRVLLGLGAVELASAVRGEHLGERVRDLLLLEDDRAVEVVAVAGHRRQVDAGLEQLLRELAGAVGPEVEEDRRVAGLDPRPSLEEHRLDELVGDARVVCSPARSATGSVPVTALERTIASKARSVRSQRWSRSIA